MSEHNSKNSAEFAAALTQMATQVVMIFHSDPQATERVANLFDQEVRGALIGDLIMSIVPSEIDPNVWLNWFGGAAVPEGNSLINPDIGHQKKARGAWQSALDRLKAADLEVARCEAALQAAKDRQSNLDAEVKATDGHLRKVIVYRIIAEIARMSAGIFAMGPAWTLMRAVSGYQARDLVFESFLDAEQTKRLEAHYATRKEASSKVHELLDLYAGDVQTEIYLFEAIARALDKRHAPVLAEIEAAKGSGAPLSAAAKRVTRKFENRRTTVRKQGLKHDFRAVLQGLFGEDDKDAVSC